MKNVKLCVAFIAFMLVIPVSGLAKKGKVLKIDFKNPISEYGHRGNSFDIMSIVNQSKPSVSLLSYVRAIDAAAEDKKVEMIYMTPDKISAGLSQIEELRAAFERFRESGKQIVAYCGTFSNGSYYLASVADKIILDPASESFITGLATQQIFLKDILDTLGVDVQIIRHGKYKSAGEMFARNTSSPENRRQYEALMNSLWNSMCSEIAASRGFTVEEFNAWIEDLDLYDAKQFKEKGLVDELWYKDQVNDYFCELYDVEKIEQVGFVKMNRYASKLKKGSRKNMIAVVYADGQIVNSGSSSDIVGSKMASTLAKVRNDKKIKAVVFRVNSPGGSAQASEAIRREIELLRKEKPVIVSFGEYAASGGYWISAGSDYIFTDNTTLTGSIGVFAIVPSLGDAIRKNLKINIETVGSTSRSDMVTGMRKLTDSEVEFFSKSIEGIYDQFVTIVADGRDMTKEAVDEIAEGRVWSGNDALGVGLADTLGGIVDAIAYAAEKVGLEKNDYRISVYPEVKQVSLMQILSGAEPGDSDETATSHIDMESVLDGLFPAAARVRNLTEPQNMLLMESIIEIR